MSPMSCSSRMTMACAVLMMMMMMMMMMMVRDAAAMPKTTKSHRKSSDGATVETVPLLLDPSALVHPNIRPLENVSISPWTYKYTSNHSFFPPVMSEAHCLLTGCLDREGKEDQNLRSVPIKHQILVLRRIKARAGHEYHFRLESRLIAVGCTCVRPTVHLQQ